MPAARRAPTPMAAPPAGARRRRGAVIALGLGSVLVLAGLAVLGWEAWAAVMGAPLRLHPLGEVWYRLAPGGLNLTQAVIERYVWAPLWDPLIVTVLRQPAAPVLAGPGLIVVGLGFWRWRRKH